MAGKTRVLVVDDSAFMRRVITDILVSDEAIEVVGTAANGREGIEKATALKPDVITLDIEMPVMDGLSCLKELLAIDRIPVLMLSSLTQKGAKETIQALEYGAVDFIAKPSNIFDMASDVKRKEIVQKVKLARNIPVLKEVPHRTGQARHRKGIVKCREFKTIVAIGTSTGGPKALQEVIPQIPGDIPATFVIVQHMPPGFTRSLANRLNSLSELTVKEAEDGEALKAGFAYIAPGDYHMKFERQPMDTITIKLTRDPAVSGHRPAVDAMLDSLSQTGFEDIITVIMTGMGGDGSNGIKKIKNINNGYIIAQDEASCVVYGMPRLAVQTGVVDAVVPLNAIKDEITKNVGVYK